ncbi:MAG: hypothetical protein F6K28_56350 [Microcoleus sp. SIO2G3]|nr:hypothetical protein [Microcoleus sp. SIO2G3]
MTQKPASGKRAGSQMFQARLLRSNKANRTSVRSSRTTISCKVGSSAIEFYEQLRV